MSRSGLKHLHTAGSTTQTAGLALLCSLLAQYLTPTFREGGGQQEEEVFAEAVCWIVLPILFKFAGVSRWTSGQLLHHRYHGSQYQHQHQHQYRQAAGSIWSPGLVAWVAALGISVACWFKAEIGCIGLFPIITPILLLVERKLHAESKRPDSPSIKASTDGSLPYTQSDFTELIPTLAISLLSIWVMLDGNTVATALSAVPTVSLVIVYVSFASSTSSTRSNHSTLKIIPSIGELEGFVANGGTSLKVTALLGMVLVWQIRSFGYPTGISFTTVPLAGLARAASWYFLIRTIHDTDTGLDDLEKDRERDHLLTQAGSAISWTIATLICTFCLLASRDPSIQPSDFQALLQVVTSLLVLGQIIRTLPRQTKARSILWSFALVSVIPYLYHGFVLRHINSTAPSWTSARPHPAEVLIQKASTDFDKLLERQSKSYEEAVGEYKRRYGISPPPGFDKWYELAVAHDSPMIDEFDTVFENISPFLKRSGKEITNIANKVSKMPNIELWDCTFTSRDDKAMTQCLHPSRSYDRHISTMFDQMLKDLKGLWLPDVRFLVNHLDEPRVIFPPQPEDARVVVETFDLSHKPTWDQLTRPCHQSDATNKTYHFAPKYPEVNTYSLPLVTDREAGLDLCQHPEYSTLNGLFTSPTSFKLISGLVPVLSTGAPSTMGDILIPSPAYSESQFQYHPESDTPWSQKRNTLYWAGSNTGGFASDDTPTSWQLFQRQRFVYKTQNIGSQSHTYLTQLSPNEITTMTSTFLDARKYDVSFTNIFQCLPSACRAQRSFFRTKSWQDPNASHKSKLAFDIDGNGISGRYYKLLASNSLPLKQTILREWHDERLWGWVHYIPVSLGLGEVPELVRYFLDTTGSKKEKGNGQDRAKEVAEKGRDWVGRGLRGVDRSLYLYRVLLEMGRVMDLEREAISIAVRD